jgi:hypothetical protein
MYSREIIPRLKQVLSCKRKITSAEHFFKILVSLQPGFDKELRKMGLQISNDKDFCRNAIKHWRAQI